MIKLYIPQAIRRTLENLIVSQKNSSQNATWPTNMAAMNYNTQDYEH